MSDVVERIKLSWSARYVRIVQGARIADLTRPGHGDTFKEGYRSGYWDGVADTLDATKEKTKLSQGVSVLT
jgi:hypothetical protein